MSHSDEDIPPGVDFLSEDAARKWTEEAEAKLASRLNFFAAFVQAVGAIPHLAAADETEPLLRVSFASVGGPRKVQEILLSGRRLVG